MMPSFMRYLLLRDELRERESDEHGRRADDAHCGLSLLSVRGVLISRTRAFESRSRTCACPRS